MKFGTANQKWISFYRSLYRILLIVDLQQIIRKLTAIRSPNWLVNLVPIQLFTNSNIVTPAKRSEHYFHNKLLSYATATRKQKTISAFYLSIYSILAFGTVMLKIRIKEQELKIPLELTVIHINRHSNLVQHCNGILKSFTVRCKSTSTCSCQSNQKKTHSICSRKISHQYHSTSANNRRVEVLVNESFSNMKHLTSLNKFQYNDQLHM